MLNWGEVSYPGTNKLINPFICLISTFVIFFPIHLFIYFRWAYSLTIYEMTMLKATILQFTFLYLKLSLSTLYIFQVSPYHLQYLESMTMLSWENAPNARNLWDIRIDGTTKNCLIFQPFKYSVFRYICIHKNYVSKLIIESSF